MPGETLVAVLRELAGRYSDRRACAFLGDGEQVTEALTYRELDAGARQMADMVARRLAPGARALVVCEPGLDFVRAFLGCLYAGVIAVPVVPPTPPRYDLGIARARSILADCGAELVLTTSLVRAGSGTGNPFGASPVLLVDGPVAGDAQSWRDCGARGGTTALLQYTSGSTGTPRGVVVTHANLLANERAIAASMAVPDETNWVSWLPLYHDMGLIGAFLGALCRGSTLYLMSPLHFIQRPDRWLRAISRYRAYVSGGPNFAYELATRRADPRQLEELDLSCWRIAFCGAEPIRRDSARRFCATFARAGFDPSCLVGCYGLAESTLLISGARAADKEKEVTVDRAALERDEVIFAVPGAPGSITIAACGRVSDDYDVRVVNPRTREPVTGPGVGENGVGENGVGEIWVSGPSVAAGYWHRPRETSETFNARLPGTGNHYLRTGDLGFVHYGQLYITGRIKDLLIVRGRNIHPHDVEDTAARAHQLCRPGGAAAFMTQDGQVVLVQETKAADPGELAEVAAAVRQAVLGEQQLSLAELLLVPPHQVPKTSSGKVQRSACRRQALGGELPVLYRDPDSTADQSVPSAAEV